MSDPYLDKVQSERAQEDLEMRTCPDCLFMEQPSRALHIALHRLTTAVCATKENQADTYENSNMPGAYAYKSKGVPEGEKMHPSYRPPKKAKG